MPPAPPPPTLAAALGPLDRAHAAQAVRAVFLVAAPAAAGVTAGVPAAGVAASTVAFGLLLTDGRGTAQLKTSQAVAVGVLVTIALLVGALIGGRALTALVVAVPLLFLLGLVRGLGHAAARIALALIGGLAVGMELAAGPGAAAVQLVAGAAGIAFYVLIDRIWPDHPVPDPKLQVARGAPLVAYAALLALAGAVALGVGFALGWATPVAPAVVLLMLVLAATSDAPRGAMLGVLLVAPVGLAAVVLRPDPRTTAIALAVVIGAGIFRSADHRVPLWLPTGVLLGLIALGA